jgi:hypothetical protein
MASRSSHEIAASPGAQGRNRARPLRLAALPAPRPLEGFLERVGETPELRLESRPAQLREARLKQPDAAPRLSEAGLVQTGRDLDESLERFPALTPFAMPDFLPDLVSLEVASRVEERPSALEQFVLSAQRRAPAITPP